MVYLAIICTLVAVVLLTFVIAIFVSQYRQLTDPSELQRLRALIAKGGHISETERSIGVLARLLNIVWLASGVLSRPLVRFVTWGQRRRLSLLADRAGVSRWGFAQIFLGQCLGATAGVLLGLWLLDDALLAAELFAYASLIVVTLLGWWLPVLLLRRRHQKRVQMMSRQLPFFLDMVGLGLDAGLNLQASIQLSLEHIGFGVLHQEWSKMLADMRAGQPRVQALRQLSQRLNISSVRQLVSSLIQGEAMGFSLGRIIQVYADQQRAQRLMQAEKLALQAPVKMLFPLAICIFPCTFIVLGFPVVVQLLGLSAVG